MTSNNYKILISVKILIICLVFSCCSCTTQGTNKYVSLDGFWRTEGYGYIFEVKGKDVDIYEVTSISCLESAFESGQLEVNSFKDIDATFKVELPGFLYSFFEIRPGPNDKVKYFKRADTNTYMYARKIPDRPSGCVDTISTDYDYVYSIFTEIYKENYPFFVVRGLEENIFFEAQSHSTIDSENSLFEKIVQKIKPLNDLHTAIVALTLDLEFWGGGGSNGGPLLERNFDSLQKNIFDKYLRSESKEYCNELIRFSYAGDEVGYLQVNSFSDFSDAGIF